jgi:hypothetical protein
MRLRIEEAVICDDGAAMPWRHPVRSGNSQPSGNLTVFNSLFLKQKSHRKTDG